MLTLELKPGQVMAMDNTSFHKILLVKEATEVVGFRAIYLPPYSPDLNPIEKFWTNLKLLD